MTKPTKQELLDLLSRNYYDYHNLPFYGMIPDWYLRYWELHEKVEEYLEQV